jgi:hypothetical protein
MAPRLSPGDVVCFYAEGIIETLYPGGRNSVRIIHEHHDEKCLHLGHDSTNMK